MSRRSPWMLLLVVLSALVVSSAGRVSAHSGLSAARPGPDATVGGEIVEIQMFFSDFVTDLEVEVTDPTGSTVEAAVDLASEIEALVTLARPLDTAGEHRVSYRIISIDEDVVEDDYVFEYAPAAPAPSLVFVEDDGGSIVPWIVAGVGAVVIIVLAVRLGIALRRTRRAA